MSHLHGQALLRHREGPGIDLGPINRYAYALLDNRLTIAAAEHRIATLGRRSRTAGRLSKSLPRWT